MTSHKNHKNKPQRPRTESDDYLNCVSGTEPTWLYNKLSWCFSWVWGKTINKAQPYISIESSIECVHPIKPESSSSKFKIYLGGLPNLYNKHRLKSLGITHILTVMLGVKSSYPDHEFNTLNIPVRDVEWEKLYKYFDTAVDFIKNCEQSDGNIFVHCKCGVSRSSTLIAAYLIREKNMSADDAIKYLQLSRPKVNPNDGFRKQLKYYESYNSQLIY